jgi:hypothetical protein
MVQPRREGEAGTEGSVMAGIMTRMSQSNKSQHIRLAFDEKTMVASLPLTGVNRPPPHPS